MSLYIHEAGALDAPVIIFLHGLGLSGAIQKETFFAKQAAREMCKMISGAKGVMVPGVGHAWSLEDPDLFTDMVRAWITDTPLPQSLMAL